MADLVIFLAIVGLMVAVGIAVGMIVAGRIDRIMAPPPTLADPAPAVVPPVADESAGFASAGTSPPGTAPTVEDRQP